MTVEIYRSSPAEISRITLSSPVTGQRSRRTQPREPEKASVGDDDDFTLDGRSAAATMASDLSQPLINVSVQASNAGAAEAPARGFAS